MGNRISWRKGKKAIMNALNEQADDVSREISDPVRSSKKTFNLEQLQSTSHESFGQKSQSMRIDCDQQEAVIHHGRKCLNDRKWKSNSEINVQHFMRSKLRHARLQQKSTKNGAKRNNQSQFRMRSSNLSLSRQSFGPGNSACHPISSQGREIIQACFGNHHNEIGHRICMRVFEKRPDYQSFVFALGKQRWLNASAELRDYLNNVVSKVHDVAAVKEISRDYGERHVQLKKYGFRTDFWVSIADAMAIECIILDMANHQPTETVMAWSQLTTLMFTSIRDGYYAALRFQRQKLRNFKTSEWQQSVKSMKSSSTSAPSIVENFVI